MDRISRLRPRLSLIRRFPLLRHPRTTAPAAAAVASGRSGAPRAGALLAFAAVEVGPFLVRGTRVTTTPGLSAHLTLSGWFLQPIGMVLLAAVAVSLGAAAGL